MKIDSSVPKNEVKTSVDSSYLFVDEKVRGDPFSKIYNNFENVFNKKVEIPSKNFLEREIDKIQKEIDKDQSSEELKNKEMDSDIKIQEEEIIYHKHEENQFINELLNEPEPEIKINNQVDTKNQPSEFKIVKKEVEENEDNRFTDKQLTPFYSDLEIIDTKRKELVAFKEVEQEFDKKILFKGYFDKSNFLILTGSKSSRNEITILDFTKQIQNINTYVEKEYFPISYSQSKMILIFYKQNLTLKNSK